MTEALDVSLDRHRPTFHFLPPSNWMNDPNGLIQWKGHYHLFYQYNPNGSFWGTMHWGHAMSDDLVHWSHMPVALAPSPDGPDADGCFSGCAVNVNGVATLMYTGVRGQDELPCIAVSYDEDLATWQKYAGNPVITAPPAELDTTIFRDHSVWKEDDSWYQLIGSGIEGIGGAALLYRSEDFRRWEYMHPLMSTTPDPGSIAERATGWECPDFFALDGRQVLVAAMWAEKPISVGYFAGDYFDHQFVPMIEGIVDPGISFYAPQSFADEIGRRIMIGWVNEARSLQEHSDAGWAGVMTLPRVLSMLDDGTLGSAPAPEIEYLRGARHRIRGGQVTPGVNLNLGEVPGNTFEMIAAFVPVMPGRIQIDVLCSEDSRERVSVSYDVTTRRFELDLRPSGITPGCVFGLTHAVPEREPVRIHIFVDHSIIEVFLNDEKCITGRAYPASARNLGVCVSEGNIADIEVWEMTTATM